MKKIFSIIEKAILGKFIISALLIALLAISGFAQSTSYLVGGFDSVTGKLVIARWFAAANESAAKSAAILDADFLSLGINNTSKCRIIEVADTVLTTSRDQATETTQALIKADVAQLADEVADATNSTTTPLTGGATFSGGYVSLDGYRGISVSVLTDQNSASSGLTVKWSDDGTNEILDARQAFTVSAANDFVEQIPRRALYYKISLTNGGVAQSALAIITRKLPHFSNNGTPNMPGLVGDYQYNGSAWEPRRGTTEITILSSASRTTTQTGSDLTNYSARGIKVVLDVTSAGTGSITLTIEGKDPASGKYFTILSSAAVTTNSTNMYTVFPGAPVSANVSANDTLPRTFRVTVTANNGNAITYSVGAILLL